MKKTDWLCIFLTTFCPLAQLPAATLEIPTDISQKAKPLTLKVLLTKLAEEATLEVKGRFRIYNPRTHQMIESGKNKWDRITYTESGLKWGGLFPGQFELRLVPADEKTQILLGGVPYKGCLEIYGVGGTVNVINEVDLENLLKATLASKIETTELHSEEVFDALVIAERTRLAFLSHKHPLATWHVSASELGYTGNPKENPLLCDAIERTQGMVMHIDSHLFPATWTPHAAGRTVSYASIFRKGVPLPKGVVQLPSQISKEETKWNASIPKSVLAKLTKLDQVDQVELFKAEGSSKVYALRLSCGNHCANLDFLTLQKAIGPTLLPSNDFSIKVEEESVLFTGYGEGLGVGLCLASAQILAEQQEDARKILVIHFPGIKLQRLETPKEDSFAFIWR